MKSLPVRVVMIKLTGWRAEGRRQKAEGRRQEAGGRRQKAGGRRHSNRRLSNVQGSNLGVNSPLLNLIGLNRFGWTGMPDSSG